MRFEPDNVFHQLNQICAFGTAAFSRKPCEVRHFASPGTPQVQHVGAAGVADQVALAAACDGAYGPG